LHGETIKQSQEETAHTITMATQSQHNKIKFVTANQLWNAGRCYSICHIIKRYANTSKKFFPIESILSL